MHRKPYEVSLITAMMLVFHNGCSKSSDLLVENQSESSLPTQQSIGGKAAGDAQIPGWEISPRGLSLCGEAAPTALSSTMDLVQRAKQCNRRTGPGGPATLQACRLACKNIWNCKGFTWYEDVIVEHEGIRCQLIGVAHRLHKSKNPSAISYTKLPKAKRRKKKKLKGARGGPP